LHSAWQEAAFVNRKVWIFIIVLIGSVGRCWSQEHQFSVVDSIGMTHFSDPSDRRRDSAPQSSPDGKYLLVVTSRGVIDSNRIESTIWLFDNATIQHSLENEATDLVPPRMLARWSGVPPGQVDSYFPVITSVRWAPDSRSVYFLTYVSVTQRRLFNVKIGSGVVHALTRSDLNVVLYSIANGVVAFTATRPKLITESRTPAPGDPGFAAGFAATGMPMSNILFPQLIDELRRQVHELYLVRNGQARQVAVSSSQAGQSVADHYWDLLALSPDGHQVVELQPVTKVPESWSAYATLVGFEDWRKRYLTNNDPDEFVRPSEYVTIDLDSGKVSPLIDGPFEEVLAYREPADAVWGPSGRRLLLTGTFLPLDDVDPSERKRRLHPCAVASLERVSRETRCIIYSRDAVSETKADPKPLRLVSASFGTTDDEVVLQFAWYDQRSQAEWYRYENGQWRLEKVSVIDHSLGGAAEGALRDSSEGIAVRIRQSLNEPPSLWATNTETGKTREIWNPNPQLARIKYGEASVYHWKDPAGDEWAGGLVKPVDFILGKRYPLVIQTHGFQDFEFITDGAYTSGMAARALASAGFVVLQVPADVRHLAQPNETADNVLEFKSAVDQLAATGMIDPKRVGIVGFSRTCWYVERALIDDPNRFAAASIVDGIDHSYWQEMLWGPARGPAEAQKIYAAKPFGDGLQTWLELAPSFHLDKVHAPLMITSIGPSSILLEWEIYSSLFQQEKPVDLFYIPADEHILQKPLERLASGQVTVDWFRFWLQGYEDPDPAKHQQYLRWHRMREVSTSADMDGAQAPSSQMTDDNPWWGLRAFVEWL
jgi:dipeptidyl aminopeptidase/acylaminoacyl peptidase